MIARRRLLQGAGLAIVSATGAIVMRPSHAEPVPNSAGTEAPRLKASADTCDCHMHIYDPRFPVDRKSTRLNSSH